MGKFTWQNGTLVTPARVEVGGQVYDVTPEQYSGQTPLSAENLNQMQDGIYEDIDKNKNDISSLKYNVETNGSEVRTGRMIDGKEEYVKRYEGKIESVSGQAKTKAQLKMPLGFNLTDVTIVEMKSYIVSNTNNIFNIDTSNFNGGNNYMLLSTTENTITISCDSMNYNNKAVVMIYYVKNN